MIAQAVTNYFLEADYKEPQLDGDKYKLCLTEAKMLKGIKEKLYLTPDYYYHLKRTKRNEDGKVVEIHDQELRYLNETKHHVFRFLPEGSRKVVSFHLFDMYFLVTNNILQ